MMELLKYILGWYIFLVGISVYNKWMFGVFEFPIIVTAFHQVVLLILSTIIRRRVYLKSSSTTTSLNSASPTASPSRARNSVHEPLNPNGDYLQVQADLQSVASSLGSKWNIVWSVYWTTMPCAIASACDIGFLNVSFKYITLSLYTMLKTSLLIFVLLFGLLFKLERFNWKLVIIIVIMTFSVSLMVIKPDLPETPEDARSRSDLTFGVILILIASMCSGLRWSFTQLLLKANPHTSNPIQTMFYLSPLMATMLFITGFTFEGIGKFFSHQIWHEKGHFVTAMLMIVPGIMAFMMTWCEFMLLQVAPLITLSIAGIFKELVTIVLGYVVFGDHLSSVNVIGLFITLADIGWYNYYRHLERLELESKPRHLKKSYELNDL